MQGALLVQTLISAGTFLAAKRAMVELDPVTLVLWRFLLSSAVFLAIIALTPGPFFPPRRALFKIMLLGVLVGPGNQLLFFRGLQHSVPAHAALLYSLTPLGVYLVSILKKTERANRRATVGILLAFLGVVVLLLGRGASALGGAFFGDLIILGAVLAWVLYTTEGKAFIAEHGPVRMTAWTMVAGTVWLLPAVPAHAQLGVMLDAAPVLWTCVLYLALLTSVASYLIWCWALSRAPASHVAVFSNLQPVFTALAAWAILHEPLHWEIGVGGALVLTGVRLTQRAR